MPPTFACKTCDAQGIVLVLPMEALVQHALNTHRDNLWKLVQEVLDLPADARLA